MIKKNTKAIFLDGEFEGEYDWKGGIPLSEGEIITVKIKGRTFRYRLKEKKVSCDIEIQSQTITILFVFKLL